MKLEELSSLGVLKKFNHPSKPSLNLITVIDSKYAEGLKRFGLSHIKLIKENRLEEIWYYTVPSLPYSLYITPGMLLSFKPVTKDNPDFDTLYMLGQEFLIDDLVSPVSLLGYEAKPYCETKKDVETSSNKKPKVQTRRR